MKVLSKDLIFRVWYPVYLDSIYVVWPPAWGHILNSLDVRGFRSTGIIRCMTRV
jgi:hypothetical protein